MDSEFLLCDQHKSGILFILLPGSRLHSEGLGCKKKNNSLVQRAIPLSFSTVLSEVFILVIV